MTSRELYEKWLMEAVEDEEIISELKQIKGDDEGIKDRFYRELAFGTGGLRGVIGAGTNRMNIYTVRKASQGFADYLNAAFEKPSVAIAYDSRKNSKKFAETAAEVFAANGILVYIFSELMPTPMLSFAVRQLSCSGGIVLTASHNPAKYNGYKVYGADGCQITLEAAEQITGYIVSVDAFGVKHEVLDQAVACETVRYIGEDTIGAYFDAVKEYSVFDCRDVPLKVVYTPLNGTGLKPVLRILNEVGISDIAVIPEQERPNAAFTTCPYPNPEEKEALALGVALSEALGADLLLGTDPDCDRVGTAVRHNEEYVLISGNQMGVLLLDFVCGMHQMNGTMPQKPIAVKTIVTSEMAQRVADFYGVELKNVLTGFKFIGEQIGLLEEKGEAGRYVFGFEESYGYLSGTHARDKDAINAAMLICEMAAYYKVKGMTLCDRLDELFSEHGYYDDRLESFTFEGADGMEHMQKMMRDLRGAQINALGGTLVISTTDYLESTETGADGKAEIDLPKSDVIGYALEGGRVVIRPSGTEPKIKVYYSLRCEDEAQAQKVFDQIAADVHQVLGV